MNNPWDIIKEISSDDGKLFKENVIKREALAGNDVFFAGLRYALDNFTTFGVKKIPVRSGVDGPGVSFNKFSALADKLIFRQLTGNAALNEIDILMNAATNEEFNMWYRRILTKDLQAGFSESTVNKAVKGVSLDYHIPVYECQLAKDCVDEDGEFDESLLCGQKQIDTKLDGMRVLTVVYPSGHVVQFSRNGKEFINFEVIKNQISKNANYFSVPTVLDGEVMSSSFQDLMKQSRRKTDVQADDSVLNLFDILPLSEFSSKISTAKQRDRTEQLQAWYDSAAIDMPNVNVHGSEIVDLDTTTGRARLQEINVLALAKKYEGIMAKDVNALYECKRSSNWLKMKPFIEESLTATAVEEGDAVSKFKGTMGAIVFEGVVDGKPVKVSVGGGYTIQARAQIWADYTGQPVTWAKKVNKQWITTTEYPSGTSVIGMIGEIRADALTKSENKDTWSMRFPRFKTWRGYVRGEKI